MSFTTTDHIIEVTRDTRVFWGIIAMLFLFLLSFNLSNMLAIVFVAHLESGSFDELNDGAFAGLRDDPDAKLFWTLVEFQFMYLYKLVNLLIAGVTLVLVACRLQGRQGQET